MSTDTQAGTQAGTLAGSTAQRDDTEDALSRVLAELENASAQGLPTVAALFKRNRATGRDDLVRKFTPDEFDPFKVGEQFGGGAYFVRCRTGAKWGSSARFDVADPRGGLGQLAPAPAPIQAPPASGLFTPEGMLTLVMQQSQAQSAQMMGILQALLTKPTENFKLTELAAVMKPSSGIGELIGAIEALDRMRGGGGGGGVEEEEDSLSAMLAAAMQAKQEGKPVDTAVVDAQRKTAARLTLTTRVRTLAALARAAFAAKLPAPMLARLVRGVCAHLKCNVTATLGLVMKELQRGGISEEQMVYGWAVHTSLKSAGAAAPRREIPPAPEVTDGSDDDDDDDEEDEGGEGEDGEGDEAEADGREEPERFEER